MKGKLFLLEAEKRRKCLFCVEPSLVLKQGLGRIHLNIMFHMFLEAAAIFS